MLLNQLLILAAMAVANVAAVPTAIQPIAKAALGVSQADQVADFPSAYVGRDVPGTGPLESDDGDLADSIGVAKPKGPIPPSGPSHGTYEPLPPITPAPARQCSTANCCQNSPKCMADLRAKAEAAKQSSANNERGRKLHPFCPATPPLFEETCKKCINRAALVMAAQDGLCVATAAVATVGTDGLATPVALKVMVSCIGGAAIAFASSVDTCATPSTPPKGPAL